MQPRFPMTPTQDKWGGRKYQIKRGSDGKCRGSVRPYTLEETISLFHESYDRIQRSYETPCLEWNCCRVQDGYGQVRFRGKDIGAHVLSWLLNKGEIPIGMKVCHHCDNPPCVNPDHLFLGSDKDNSDDAKKKGRLAQLKGSLNGWALMTEEKVTSMRQEWIPYKVSARKLAEKYGLSQTQTERILRNEAWQHVPLTITVKSPPPANLPQPPPEHSACRSVSP